MGGSVSHSAPPPPAQSSASSMMGGKSSSGEKQGFLGGVPPLAWFACPARGGCGWGNATFRGVLPCQEGRPLALNNGTGPAWPCAARRGGGIAPAARRASCCPPPLHGGRTGWGPPPRGRKEGASRRGAGLQGQLLLLLEGGPVPGGGVGGF